MKNLEKKRDLCDKPFFEFKTNNSGMQVTVNLNTIAYEALTNYTTFVVSQSGYVTLVKPIINCEDLEKSTIETQYFLRLCKKDTTSNSDIGSGWDFPGEPGNRVPTKSLVSSEIAK